MFTHALDKNTQVIFYEIQKIYKFTNISESLTIEHE